MKINCFICNSPITINSRNNYCVKCGSNFDSEMRFIPSRHNWNLEDYSKSFLKAAELSRSKHQN